MGCGSPSFAESSVCIKLQDLTCQMSPHGGAIWLLYAIFAWPFLSSPLSQLWATYKHHKSLMCSEHVNQIRSISWMDLQLVWTQHQVQYLAHYSHLQPEGLPSWEYSRMHPVAAAVSTRMKIPEKARSSACVRCHLPLGLPITSIVFRTPDWVYRTPYAYCNRRSPFKPSCH